MAKRMLIDATHSEETRVVVLDGNRLEEFDFESSTKKQIKGNIYLAKITRVEPSLQAAFVEFGGNRHGFLAFSEIHPDYYRIPVGDREAEHTESSGRGESGRGESGRGERRERRRPDHRRRREPAGDIVEAAAEALEDDAQKHDGFEEHSYENGAEEHGRDVEAAHEHGGGEPDDHDAVAHETIDHDAGDGEHFRARPFDDQETRGELGPHEHDGSSHALDAEDHYSHDHDAHRHGDEPADRAEGPAEDAGVVGLHPEGEQPDRDRLLAERSAPDEITALPSDVEAPLETASSAELQSEALGFGQEAVDDASYPKVSDDTTDRSESGYSSGLDGEEVRLEPRAPATEIQREGPAEAFETLGGDDFEEAARQRSRSMRHYKIQEVIKRRQILLVQVTKEERGNKGAALTTYLSLAGRYCVLMPNTGRGGGVSRKITSTTDRRRLKDILEELDIPEGMGVIVRTAGSERSKAEIKRDFEYLLRLWDEMRTLTLQSTAPALIYEEGNLIKRSIRDLYARDIDEVLIDGEEGYRTAKAFMKMLMPSHAKRVQPYRDPTPLFHRYQVESQIDLIHSPVVQLKSGGYIVINPTEALVAIDVNSGRSTKERNIEETATRTNLEAADEVARQLRLRDLAGLIVIDFIDMEEHRNQAAVERRIKEAMKWDRARIQVGRISAFGLLELSRQRLRPSLIEASTLPCPHCSGTGTIRSTESTALHVLRAIEEEGIRRRSAEICIYVPTNVALYILNQKREALAQIEARYGFDVSVANDDTLIPPAFRLERLRAFTPAEIAMLPVPVAPPPQIEEEDEDEIPEDEEELVGTAAATEAQAEEAGTESGEELSDEERSRRRRRRRRRRRPEDESLAAQDGGGTDGEHDGAVAAMGDGSAEDLPDEHAELAERLNEAVGEEAAGNEAANGSAEGEAQGRKRRRRGKRGGRRRHGEDTSGLEAAEARPDGDSEMSVEPGDSEMNDSGANESGADDSGRAAVEQIEVVDEPMTPASTSVQDEVEAAFSAPPVSVSDDMIDTAQAPVFDGGEALRWPVPTTEPEHSVAASPAEPEQPTPEQQTASPSAEPPVAVETVEPVATGAPAAAQPKEAPAPKGSTMPEPTIVSEKPQNPKRGWWSRLLQP